MAEMWRTQPSVLEIYYENTLSEYFNDQTPSKISDQWLKG